MNAWRRMPQTQFRERNGCMNGPQTRRFLLALAFTFGGALSLIAACVTPDQLKGAVANLKLKEDDFKVNEDASRIKFVSQLFVDLIQVNVEQDLKFPNPANKVADLALELKKNANQPDASQRAWDERVPTAATAGSAARNKVFQRVQDWANFGELVIAIDASGRIGIVVPADAQPGQDLWKEIVVPHIALVDVSPTDAMKLVVFTDQPISLITTDPGTLAFYRFAK